jgi:glycosyltransferase involved in cell wall biosynthesis
MNIGFDAKRFFHNRTGLGHYSRSLVKLLVEKYPENQYHLYSPKAGGSFEREAKTFDAHIHTNKSSFPSFVWRTFGIGRDLKRDKIDLFHGLSNELPLNLDKCKIPGIVTIHDLLFKRLPEYYKPADRFIYDQKTRLVCKNASKIIAISKATRKDLIKFYGVDENKIIVIPPVSSFEVQTKIHGTVHRDINTKPYLLCISGFEKRKNIERLIAAYSQSSRYWQLVIAGKKGNTATDCLKLVENLNLKQKITIHFNPTDAEIRSYYLNACAFIYPSHYEGFGIPVLDALQFNLPILTSECTSMAEIAGDAALYFSSLNIESIAESIDRIAEVMNDKNLFEKIALRQKLFLPERVAQLLIKSYCELH